MANPHRFYISDPLLPGSIQNLPGPVAHHIRKVLRLHNGETVHLWNGDGAYREAVLHFDADGMRTQVSTQLPLQPHTSPRITLVQALPEGDKMDWIIEKACEAGVDRILPVQARRSVVRLSAERAAKRFEHWTRVAIAACSQCGRARLPQIGTVNAPLGAFETVVAGHALALLLSPAAELSAGTAVQQQLARQAHSGDAESGDGIAIAIGPEGGWDPAEEADAAHAGFTTVKLAGNTLRTETAGLYVVAQIRAWAESYT